MYFWRLKLVLLKKNIRQRIGSWELIYKTLLNDYRNTKTDFWVKLSMVSKFKSQETDRKK